MEVKIDRNLDRSGYEVSEKLYKIWETELLMADELLKICKKHDIKIFAFAGTMLGAVRHKGFIPWDDDMDFAMDRENFYKLLSVAEGFKEPLFLQYALNDRRFFMHYARLRNSNTTGIIKWTKSPEYHNGIFIDIFVLDSVPESDFKLKCLLAGRKFYNGIFHGYYTENIIKDFGRKKPSYMLFHAISKLHSYEIWYEKYGNFMANFAKKSDKIGLLSHHADYIRKYWCYKSDLNNVVYLPFEGIEIPVLANYDSILRHSYRNYMEFPPEEQRGKWHEDQIVFEPDVPYLEYLKKENDCEENSEMV